MLIDVNEELLEEAMANDEELCKSMIQQNEDMDTGCEQLENDGCTNTDSRTDVTANEESEPME